MSGHITITVDAAACGTKCGSHLKIPKDDFMAKVYPELPSNKKAMFDAQKSISIGFRDVDLIFQAQMVVEIKRRNKYCTLGEGVWWDYARQKHLVPNSTLKLRYHPAMDEIHVVS